MTSIEFLARRAIRIYPIYWIALILNSIMLMGWTLFFQMDKTISINPLALFKILFLIPDVHNPITVAWTLNFEMAFYLLFGLFFFKNRYVFIITFLLWISICYINEYFLKLDYLIVLKGLDGYNSLIAYLNPIVTEFLLGSFVAFIYMGYKKKFPFIFLILGIVYFALSCIATYGHAIENANRVWLFGLPAAFVIYGLIQIKTAWPRLLLFLGDASYSIYLFHTSLFQILTKSVTFLKLSHYVRNFYASSILFILVICGCCLIYLYVEKPLLRLGKQFIKNFISPIKKQETSVVIHVS